jgi:hypothetical protein
MDANTRLPKRPKIFSKHEHVWIKQFGPRKLFPLKNRDARILADSWKGCTQASTHATTNTTHPTVDPPELAEALSIVLEHLEKNLYLPNGFDLLEVLQDQEHRRKFPLL